MQHLQSQQQCLNPPLVLLPLQAAVHWDCTGCCGDYCCTATLELQEDCQQQTLSAAAAAAHHRQ
jgi:hypothetical protein